MTKIKTKAEFEAAINSMRSHLVPILEYAVGMKDRWSQEREYEDFADYENAVKAFCEKKGLKVTKMDKRFKITFENGIAMSCNFDGYRLVAA